MEVKLVQILVFASRPLEYTLLFTSLYKKQLYIYVCVCVCVCEGKREREREKICVFKHTHISIRICLYLCIRTQRNSGTHAQRNEGNDFVLLMYKPVLMRNPAIMVFKYNLYNNIQHMLLSKKDLLLPIFSKQVVRKFAHQLTIFKSQRRH